MSEDDRVEQSFRQQIYHHRTLGHDAMKAIIDSAFRRGTSLYVCCACDWECLFSEQHDCQAATREEAYSDPHEFIDLGGES